MVSDNYSQPYGRQRFRIRLPNGMREGQTSKMGQRKGREKKKTGRLQPFLKRDKLVLTNYRLLTEPMTALCQYTGA